MKTFDVEFTRHADDDFDAILHFIARENPLRAISFVDELQQRLVAVLSIAPNAGARVSGYRFITFGRYIVVYGVNLESNLVSVVMISEGHRNWRAILKDRDQS